jgi:hypothetical protein
MYLRAHGLRRGWAQLSYDNRGQTSMLSVRCCRSVVRVIASHLDTDWARTEPDSVLWPCHFEYYLAWDFEDYLAQSTGVVDGSVVLSVKRPMSGHPRIVRLSGAVDAKPDGMIDGQEDGPAHDHVRRAWSSRAIY